MNTTTARLSAGTDLVWNGDVYTVLEDMTTGYNVVRQDDSAEFYMPDAMLSPNYLR